MAFGRENGCVLISSEAKPRSRAHLRETDTMYRDLFCPTGRIYRGNLHGHCTHSDGRNEAAEVVVLCREAGYASRHLFAS